jgi:hypothetical protein
VDLNCGTMPRKIRAGLLEDLIKAELAEAGIK